MKLLFLSSGGDLPYCRGDVLEPRFERVSAWRNIDTQQAAAASRFHKCSLGVHTLSEAAVEGARDKLWCKLPFVMSMAAESSETMFYFIYCKDD